MEHWTAELVYDAHVHLGEAPLWDERTGEVVFVDILAGVVHRFDPQTGFDRPLDVGQPVGCAVTRATGGYGLAVRDGFAVADNHDMRILAPVETDRPDNRMNDGACDSRGRFWAGTMSTTEEPSAGSLYRLDPSGEVTTVLDGVTISNGIAWSPDDQLMYYVDTPTMGVDVFDYDATTGTVTNRRRLVTIEEGAGFPDGLVVDTDGCLWLGLWEGWSVRRYSPTGEMLGRLDVPVARVTKAAFGGPDLADLYVATAASEDSDPSEPLAGGLFQARPGAKGLPSNQFVG